MPHTRTRTALAGVLTLATLALAGCSADDRADGRSPAATSDAGAAGAVGSATSADAVLAPYGLDGLEAVQVVDALEATPLAERPADLTASVRPREVVLDSPAGTATLPLPDDAFYLSLAPYVSATHPCAQHSLTTCRGELGGAEVALTVVDDATGKTLVDDTRTAADNGFVGLWLPRDRELTVRVQVDGRAASTQVTTSDDADTCLTTLQLT
ncbi:hypothetical protein CLV28_2615 [Sediminihabitans luteus]|uniref:Uncharacterized protein n=1 Tax=Sediminihabitans luteus TaxID=1138585 RepID=A0A2M9CCV3_9CELL|nr:CueP family metal-binding protein [Sediminihabitans luteus]PJJ69156.1 hypothetical protein CLV28_2615 [Sediminihabitans luteus]GII98828.1 hypothetical protein Slu03_12060 [Sediminihabitans luteus]